VTGGTKATATTAAAATSFSKSTSVDVTVDQYNTLNGAITAAAAQSFTADIAGTMTNTVTLAAATSAVFTDTNKDTNNSVGLVADKLTDLVVTNAGDFTMTGSSLAALESLTVDASKHFDANDINLAKVASVELSGAGDNAQVTLGDLGLATKDYGTTLNAEGLAAGLTVGDILTDEGQAISVNVAGVLGGVTIGDVTVADSATSAKTGSITIDANGTAGNIELGALSAKSVTVDAAGALGDLAGPSAAVVIDAETASFTGSALGANDVTVTASKTGTVIGGIEADAISVVGGSVTGETAAFTLTGGLGADVFDVAAGSGGETTVTITDFVAGSDTITSVAGVTLTTTEAVAILSDAFSVTAVAADITLVNLKFGGVEANIADGFVYGGNTYFASATAMADGEVAVQLVGVELADGAVIVA